MEETPSKPPRPRSTVSFKAIDMVRELLAYGEPEAAEKIQELSDEQIQEIGFLAYKNYSTFWSGQGPMLDTAICRAIVEYLEGEARPLRRKRRAYPKQA